MTLKARLIARDAADGTNFIRDDVPLGREYLIETSSIGTRPWGVLGKTGDVMRITVWAESIDGSGGGYMPMELLDVEGL